MVKLEGFQETERLPSGTEVGVMTWTPQHQRFKSTNNFFDMDNFLRLYWICYNIASVSCFGFLGKSMWDHSSLNKDWTLTLFITRQNLNQWTPVAVPGQHLDSSIEGRTSLVVQRLRLPSPSAQDMGASWSENQDPACCTVWEKKKSRREIPYSSSRCAL